MRLDGLPLRANGRGCRSPLPWALIVATVVTMAAALVPAGAARAANASTATVTLLSDPNDFVGRGEHRLFASMNASIVMTGNPNTVVVNVSGGTLGDSFRLVFAAPDTDDLRAGYYDGAQRAPFREAGHPGIDITGDGRGCNTDAGRFDVKDIAISGGTPTRLWLTYEQHCEGGLPALFGEVRIGEPNPSGAVEGAPGMLWWPDADLGTSATTVPVWLVNVGEAPATIGHPHIAGLHASDFAMRLNLCPKTLAAGAFCQVYVRFTPLVAGPHVASLDTKVNGKTFSVRLDAAGIGGRTQLRMRSDKGDYIGGGQTYHYQPADAQFTFNGNLNEAHAGLSGNDGSWWYLDFKAPGGDVFAPGRTYQATRYPFQGAGAGMSIYGNGRGCNTLTGTFTITKVGVAPSGVLTSFGVKFVQHCEGATPALRGKFEYRVPVGDRNPPGPVTGVIIVRGGGSAGVSWTTPADGDLAFIMVRYLTAATVPGSPDGSLFGYAGMDTSVVIHHVPTGGPFAVAIYAVDTAGNVSTPVTATA